MAKSHIDQVESDGAPSPNSDDKNLDDTLRFGDIHDPDAGKSEEERAAIVSKALSQSAVCTL